VKNQSLFLCLWAVLFFLNSCSEDSTPTSAKPAPSVVTSPSSASSEQGSPDLRQGEEEDNSPLPIINGAPAKKTRIQELLVKANPDYRGQGSLHEQGGEIIAGEFPGCGLSDLSPLRGLKLQMLDLSGNPVREIRHLRGMPLIKLFLENTGVESLRELREAKLVELRLNGSPVLSLDGLQGQPLEMLYAVGTRISDIEPLRKSNLRQLWLSESPVADLSPLAGLPLESLTVHRTLVNDLSFVRKLPVIQRLHIGETLIDDLTPLEGLRLTRLVFTPSRIKRGIEVARRLSNLREIGVAFDDQRQELMPPGQFWAQYGK
jgi:hypothetical protein